MSRALQQDEATGLCGRRRKKGRQGWQGVQAGLRIAVHCPGRLPDTLPPPNPATLTKALHKQGRQHGKSHRKGLPGLRRQQCVHCAAIKGGTTQCLGKRAAAGEAGHSAPPGTTCEEGNAGQAGSSRDMSITCPSSRQWPSPRPQPDPSARTRQRPGGVHARRRPGCLLEVVCCGDHGAHQVCGRKEGVGEEGGPGGALQRRHAHGVHLLGGVC